MEESQRTESGRRCLFLENRFLPSVLAVILAFLLSCAVPFPSKQEAVRMTDEEVTEVLKGRTQQEIHDHWGEPESFFSGLYGDIYVYNDMLIGVVYDFHTKTVEYAVITEKQI